MVSRYTLPRWAIGLTITIFIVGFISRIAPMFDMEGRLLQQFVTEDGYLMLTIARNVALGLGMSTAEGTIATNGTQPFTTFIWAIGYLFSDANKIHGVMFAHIVQLVVSIASSYILYRLARKVFNYSRYNKEVAFILSALFFASPHILPHTMNFLETGVFLFAILIVVYTFEETDEDAENLWTITQTIGVGILLGWMFWVRIDSAFIILAVCLSYLFRGIPFGRSHLQQRFLRVIIFGSVSVLVALPWLINNYVRFGSITPISGQSQADQDFAHNIAVVPSILVEYLSIIFPIPQKFQDHSLIVIICLMAVILASAILIYIWKKTSQRYRSLILMGVITTICYVGYYGLFFGAKHFMARYLAALAPFISLFTAACILYLVTSFYKKFSFLFVVTSLGVMAIVIGLNGWIYKKGMPHQHSAVVNWVKENVPEDTWIGAIQTGTLGYFHDRTINMDGKVNPEALAVRQGKSHCPETDTASEGEIDCLPYYIVSKEIWYFVDWYGFAEWADKPPMDQHFTVVVSDPDANLTVLKRHNAPEKQ